MIENVFLSKLKKDVIKIEFKTKDIL